MADLYQSPLTSPLQGPLVPQTTTLTDGATIALDASLGDHFVVTLGGNRTLAAPTNPKGGQRLTLAVIQDGVGARTLTFNAAYDFNGATPTLNAAASAVTLFLFAYNPSTSKWISVKVNTPVTTADLAAGILSADAAGRAKMADDYFTATQVSTVGAGGKFDAGCITAAGALHLFAAGAIDATAAAAIIAAGAIPASKLEAGGAAAGITSAKVQQTAAQAAGAMTSAPTVPVVLELAIADAATGNDDFTGLVGKHKVINAWVVTEAGGDAGNTYQLQTGGGVAVTDAIAPGASSGSVGRAANIATAPTKIFANAATLRVAHVRNAASSLAKFYVELVPVA